MSNIISIDLEESYFKAKLKLCRPNRQPIDNMVDISDRKLHVRLGNIHDLSFSVPYYVTRNHKKVKNPLLDKIKLGYLVQLDFKNEREYFVIMDDSKSMDSNGDTITFNLKSLAYRLGKFDVREFEVEAYPLSQIMLGTTAINGILAETNWTLGHVDVDFDLIYRSISISTSTVLQAVFDVAEKFGAVPDFDTVNRKINFIKMESTGFNKGFKSTEGKYLESYGIDTTLDEIVTRLKCYGEEGLEFRNLSPIGANYLQDFSYFMYGFECDSSYNVLSSSEYGMSDSLCIALTRYNNLVNVKNSEFNTLISQKTTKQAELVQLQQELSVLTTEKKMLEHQLDLINITYADQAPSRSDWQSLNTQLNSKLSSITAKENQVTSKEDEITSIENNIITLGQLLSTENNFTEEQLDELKDYIYVKEFSDTSIVDEEDLLKAGIEQFRKYREPKVTLKLDLVDFTNDFEYQADKKKINLGDITTFFSKRLNVEIQSRITEIEYDLDELNISLTISNDINKTTDEDILADLLKNVSNTSLTLDMNMYKLDLAKNANTMVNHLLEAAFDTGKNILLGGLANTNEMTERGFYSRDYYDSNNTFLVINGGGLYITKDSARSVEVAINKDGVHSRRLVGNIVLSNKVMVESTSGIVTIEDNAITIKDTSMSNRVILGRYPNPSTPSQYKYGLYVSDGAVDIRTSSTDNRGVQLDSEGIRSFNSNGVRTFDINSSTGKVSIVGELEFKTSSSNYRGVVLDGNGLKAYNSSGTETVSIDAQTGKFRVASLFEIKTSDSNSGRIIFSNEGIRAYDPQDRLTFKLDTVGGFTSVAYDEDIAEVSSRITQTATEIRAEVKDVEEGLDSKITQTAAEIRSEVGISDYEGDMAEVNSKIIQTATEIRAEVNDLGEDLNTRITQTASEIRAEVNDKGEGLDSKITQTASTIRAEVNDVENGLDSKITQTAGAIRAELSTAVTTIEDTIDDVKTTITSEYKSDIEISAQGLRSTFSSAITTMEADISTMENNVAYIQQTSNSLQATVASQQTTIGNFGTRVSIAEATVSQTATALTSKVSTVDYTGERIATLITQTASDYSIKASKINLDGAVLINGSITGRGSINIENNATIGKKLYLNPSIIEGGSTTSSLNDCGIQFGTNRNAWQNSYIRAESSSAWSSLEVHAANSLYLSGDMDINLNAVFGDITMNAGILDLRGISSVLWGSNRPTASWG